MQLKICYQPKPAVKLWPRPFPTKQRRVNNGTVFRTYRVDVLAQPIPPLPLIARMQLLSAEPYLNLHLHPGPEPAIETEWLGYANSADFRRAISLALQLAQQHKVRGWVADDRRLGAVRPRDLEWLRTEMLPALAVSGVKRFALLDADDSLNRLTIGWMYEQVSDTISFEIQHFADISQARVWATGS